MRLTAAELTLVFDILTRIDDGRTRPQLPDRIGRFFRQYEHARMDLDGVLARRGVRRRADAAISGRSLGAVHLAPLVLPSLRLCGFPLGEVADTLAVAEELGTLVELVLWQKSPDANSCFNLIREGDAGVYLRGDYRWTPPRRLTPGEAAVQEWKSPTGWQAARCLKAVADDLARPPHALEFQRDSMIGPPGLKFFRSVCALRKENRWWVLSAVAPACALEIEGTLPGMSDVFESGDLAQLLLYREPWSTGWVVAWSARIEPEDALAHAITWADFRSEILQRELDESWIATARARMRELGIPTTHVGQPNLTRTLLPLARDLLSWLRGYG